MVHIDYVGRGFLFTLVAWMAAANSGHCWPLRGAGNRPETPANANPDGTARGSQATNDHAAGHNPASPPNRLPRLRQAIESLTQDPAATPPGPDAASTDRPLGRWLRPRPATPGNANHTPALSPNLGVPATPNNPATPPHGNSVVERLRRLGSEASSRAQADRNKPPATAAHPTPKTEKPSTVPAWLPPLVSFGPSTNDPPKLGTESPLPTQPPLTSPAVAPTSSPLPDARDLNEIRRRVTQRGNERSEQASPGSSSPAPPFVEFPQEPPVAGAGTKPAPNTKNNKPTGMKPPEVSLPPPGKTIF